MIDIWINYQYPCPTHGQTPVITDIDAFYANMQTEVMESILTLAIEIPIDIGVEYEDLG